VDNRHVTGDVLRRIAIRFTDDGLSPGAAVECISASAAVLQAETLSMVESHAGAVAFSRTGDPGAGIF
jgi:hypothetical protein